MSEKLEEAKNDLKEFMLGLLPNDVPPAINLSTESMLQKMVSNLLDAQSDIEQAEFYDFCKRHDLCSVCAKGGWNCGSDHK